MVKRHRFGATRWKSLQPAAGPVAVKTQSDQARVKCTIEMF